MEKKMRANQTVLDKEGNEWTVVSVKKVKNDGNYPIVWYHENAKVVTVVTTTLEGRCSKLARTSEFDCDGRWNGKKATFVSLHEYDAGMELKTK